MPNHFSLGLLIDEPVFTLTIYNEGTYVRAIEFDYDNILNVIEEFKHLQPRIVYPLEKLYEKYIETGDPESRYEVLNELSKEFKSGKDLYGRQVAIKDNEAPETDINGASNIQSHII